MPVVSHGPSQAISVILIPIKCNLFNSHMVIWAEESSRFAKTYCKLFNILLNECQTEHSNVRCIFLFNRKHDQEQRSRSAEGEICHVSAVHGYRVTL